MTFTQFKKKKKRVTMTGVYANIRAHFLVFLVASLCKRVCMTTDVPTHMWHVAIYFLSNQYGICCLHRTDMQMLNSMLRMLQLSLKMDNKIISIKNERSLMSDTSPYFPEKKFSASVLKISVFWFSTDKILSLFVQVMSEFSYRS